MADITQVDDPMDVDEPGMAAAPLVAPPSVRRMPVLPPSQESQRPSGWYIRLVIERYLRSRDRTLPDSNSRSQITEELPSPTDSDLNHLVYMLHGVKGVDHGDLGNIPLATRRNRLIACQIPGRLIFEMTESGENTFSNAVHRFIRVMQTGREIYKKISVRYIDPTGVRRGRDGGGLSAEFWTKIGLMLAEKEIFVIFPDRENVNWYFTTNKFEKSHLKAVGTMLAKALLDEATLPISLSPVVYKLICGIALEASDLKFVDPELWNRLISKEGRDIYISNEFTFTPLVLDRRNIRDPSDWCLDTPRDKDEVVTEETYEEWAHLQCHFILLKSVYHSARNILEGFYTIIPKDKLVRKLTPKDLQDLIEGQKVMDAATFWRRCHYRGAAERKLWFKIIVENMTQEQIGKLLFFITGLQRMPRAGSNICIREQAHFNGAQLPSAHTCGWVMDVPIYESRLIMREKILQAIEVTGYAFE